MTPIEISDLCQTFRAKKGKKVNALCNLTLQVPQGEVFGFLGPNGAGKSSTIKTLMGLIRPTSGEARLYGVPVDQHAARRRVGYLPENPSFFDYLTAREYLAFVGRAFGMPAEAIRQHSERVLELLALVEASNRPIRGFSKGMVQRLGLAQALLHDPDLYILDEPMSGLDPIGRALVKQIMMDLKKKGKTVFFSTHVTSDVEAVCDRVGIIVEGRLRALKSVEEIMDQGLDGYRVQLTGVVDGALAEFSPMEKRPGVSEVYVPRHELTAFMSKAEASGAQVCLLEPQRKDLEAFFLDIVRQENA